LLAKPIIKNVNDDLNIWCNHSKFVRERLEETEISLKNELQKIKSNKESIGDEKANKSDDDNSEVQISKVVSPKKKKENPNTVWLQNNAPFIFVLKKKEIDIQIKRYLCKTKKGSNILRFKNFGTWKPLLDNLNKCYQTLDKKKKQLLGQHGKSLIYHIIKNNELNPMKIEDKLEDKAKLLSLQKQFANLCSVNIQTNILMAIIEKKKNKQITNLLDYLANIWQFIIHLIVHLINTKNFLVQDLSIVILLMVMFVCKIGYVDFNIELFSDNIIANFNTRNNANKYLKEFCKRINLKNVESVITTIGNLYLNKK